MEKKQNLSITQNIVEKKLPDIYNSITADETLEDIDILIMEDENGIDQTDNNEIFDLEEEDIDVGTCVDNNLKSKVLAWLYEIIPILNLNRIEMNNIVVQFCH